MAKTKGWIWISLALVCALSAGGLTYYLLQQQGEAVRIAEERAREQAAPVVQTVGIPVAARDMERGQPVTAADLEIKAFPVDLAPSSAISDTALLDGRVLAEPIGKGDIFRETALYGGSGAALSSEIEPGKTIMAFPIVDLFGETGLIVEGDRVDLLLSVDLEAIVDGQPVEAGKITGYTVQNVHVLRVLSATPNEENPSPRPTGLLLELTPNDAVLVKKVKDAGGTIDLALRSVVDREPFEVGPVTDDDLVRLMNGQDIPETVGGAR